MAKTLFGGVTLHFSGDLSGFAEMYLSSSVTFKGDIFPSIFDLHLRGSFIGSADDIIQYASVTPEVQRIHVDFSRRIDFTRVVRKVPSLKELHLVADKSDDIYKLIEATALDLKVLGCATKAVVATGTFQNDQYDSDSGSWQSYSDR